MDRRLRTASIAGATTILLGSLLSAPAHAAVPVASCLLSGGKQRLTYTAKTSGWPNNGDLGKLTLIIHHTVDVKHEKNWVGTGTQMGPTTVTATVGTYTGTVTAAKGSEIAGGRCGPTIVRIR